jgi:hypothetical protein
MESSRFNSYLSNVAPYMRQLLGEASQLLDDAIYSHVFDTKHNSEEEIEESDYYICMKEIDELLERLDHLERCQE